MTLDLALVRTRCVEIDQAVARLDGFRPFTRERFVADDTSVDQACRRLLQAIDAAVAICDHICAARFHVAVGGYTDGFSTLAVGGVIAPDLARRLTALAKYRNPLVHMIWKLNHDRVYDAIQQDLPDLRAFAVAIGELTTGAPNEPA